MLAHVQVSTFFNPILNTGSLLLDVLRAPSKFRNLAMAEIGNVDFTSTQATCLLNLSATQFSIPGIGNNVS